MQRLILWLAVLVFLGSVVVAVAQADIILWNDEQITVSSAITETVVLYDTSHAAIVPGGEVPSLYTNNESTVDISGGEMGWPSYAYNQSTVTMSSGTMASLFSMIGNLISGSKWRALGEGDGVLCSLEWPGKRGNHVSDGTRRRPSSDPTVAGCQNVARKVSMST